METLFEARERAKRDYLTAVLEPGIATEDLMGRTLTGLWYAMSLVSRIVDETEQSDEIDRRENDALDALRLVEDEMVWLVEKAREALNG